MIETNDEGLVNMLAKQHNLETNTKRENNNDNRKQK